MTPPSASDAILNDAVERFRELRASIHLGCPHCGVSYLLPVFKGIADNAGTPPGLFNCDNCGFRFPFHSSEPEPNHSVERCFVCGNSEFFVQKDFNRTLGFWIVMLSGIVTFLVMVGIDHRVGIGVLFAVTMIDWIVYRRLKEVSVCYLCNSIYRGFPPNPAHKVFHLGDEERFKKLRKTWLESTNE